MNHINSNTIHLDYVCYLQKHCKISIGVLTSKTIKLVLLHHRNKSGFQLEIFYIDLLCMNFKKMLKCRWLEIIPKWIKLVKEFHFYYTPPLLLLLLIAILTFFLLFEGYAKLSVTTYCMVQFLDFDSFTFTY